MVGPSEQASEQDRSNRQAKRQSLVARRTALLLLRGFLPLLPTDRTADRKTVRLILRPLNIQAGR